MPLLTGLEPGRGRERGLDASHSLFHSFQQLFFEHLLLRAEDLQPKDTASGGSPSGEDGMRNASPPTLPASRKGCPLAPAACPSLHHGTCLPPGQGGQPPSPTRPVNPGPHTAPRRCPINVHGLKG